jgi:neopullulanase
MFFRSDNQCLAQNSFIKIEPPNWWTDMPKRELQLLCYGKGIGQAKVQINHKGIALTEAHKAESPNYLFLDIEISENAEPGEVNINFLFPNDAVEKVMYPLNERKDFEPKNINASDIIYLITPDRFANGDKDNDNLGKYQEPVDITNLFGRHGGDIAGISAHVDYLDSMGFTAIWSSPLIENDQPQASYHGYAATDLYTIDERMGSLESYVKLSEQLHAKDMKLIMDFVPNHIGHHHWWMKDLPFENWVNGTGIQLTHHNRNVLHDPHATASDKQAFTTGWFVETMPDLNQQHPLLGKYLLQNAIWWVETAQLDGLRIDTYPYSNHEFMNTWSCMMRQLYPSLALIGEEWTTNADYISYWQKGNTRNPGSCLPSLFDFPLQEAIVKSLNEEEAWNTGWIHLHEALSADYLYPNADDLVIFLDNHDMDRIYRQLEQSFWKLKFGLTILMTMRGIPQIYYGTEVMLTNSIANNHGDIRTHFPGTWPHDEYDARKPMSIAGERLAAQALVRKLNEFRSSAAAVQNGTLIQSIPKHAVYSYLRQNDTQTVLVILNKSDEHRFFNLGTFKDHLPLGEAVELFSGLKINEDHAIEIPGKDVKVLTWNHVPQ